MIHLKDIGEPGRDCSKPTAVDPCTHCLMTAIENDPDCDDCTDFYQIVIYDSTNSDPLTGECSGNPLWWNGSPISGCPDAAVMHRNLRTIRAGNVQMHPNNNGEPIFNSEVFCDNRIDNYGDKKTDCTNNANCINDPACH
jgi:hypothetical protein